MSEGPFKLITSDAHAGGSHARYREYLDPKYRAQFDEWHGGVLLQLISPDAAWLVY